MKLETIGRKIHFTFESALPGGIVPEPLVFDADRVHTAQHEQAEMHGWIARLRDAAAIARKQKSGTVINVTEDMRRAAVAELVDHYHGGSADWSPKSREPKAAPQNATILAIAAKRGCTYAEAEAYIAEKMLAELGE